jgi:hypothetical protein
MAGSNGPMAGGRIQPKSGTGPGQGGGDELIVARVRKSNTGPLSNTRLNRTRELCSLAG